MISIFNKEKLRRGQRFFARAFHYKHAFLLSCILLICALTGIAAPCYAKDDGIAWTEEELAFMSAHPVIYLGVDPEFIPFEFIDDDGEYKGIAADYLAIISEKTGMEFKVVEGLTWPEAYDKAIAGEIDALPAIGKTAEREQHFLFSEPYYSFKRVIVTRDSATNIAGMEDLEGKMVAVQRNSSHHSYMLQNYPDVNLSIYDSVETALTAVAAGTETAYIGNLATVSYLIRSNGITDLRFIAFEAEKKQDIHFAVRKDLPELISIFNKALDAIPQSEKLVISNKWVDLEADVNIKPFIRILAIVGGVIAVVLAVSFFWIARLKKEILQRKKIQLDLEEAKREADTANEFKSSFMARMSHEIRTPLNAITGMSYLLKKTETTITQSMYIDRIMQASNNMLSIINDILDFSKIEAGKVELEITSFNMDQVIQDVVNIISYKIDEQEIGFRLSKDPLVPNWFLGDARRIEQILLNVLNNAAKFTNTGEVSLDVRLIAKENDKYHISFTIRDTGIGMTEEQVGKLFLPFEQGDSSINRRFGGSGLGLSIVKNLVDMMGGEIKVFSTPGEGSTFIIRLSMAVDKEKESVYIKAISANHFKNVRTLILEKSGANINLIENYMGSFGMQCELTSSEASAVSMLEAANGKFAAPFDLFIIDYDTPAEGGYNFVEALRNNPKIAKIPKLMLLLPMMRADLFDKLSDHGIDIGIGKPVIPSILLNGILDIFNLKAVSGSRISIKKESEPVKMNRSHLVLLVEDNKTNQLIARSLLEQAGLESIVANDGKEAVERYIERRDSIDLVLMDLHMPVMNGYEAAEKIRELSSDIPIVAMTADVILGVRDKCAKYGIHHYISKPFNPDYFVKTVKDIILENEVREEEPVLDRQAGIKNMGENQELYRKVLEEYRNENRDVPERLKAAVHEKRYADAAQIVHKVKSSSGSIGAATLHEIAKLLQKALEEEKEDEILSLLDKCLRIFRKLLKELE